ncbi:MAG: hypothetical protein KKB82_03700 [Candidatus Omnitrophica bacterium]|nr:hypothetical protein [Candidatus Omnitrophota bacterium]MBU1925011.1 hypothetical protein [Candidatus Omnitrophota bacterium]
MKVKQKNVGKENIKEKDLFDVYVREMDELVNKYPQDPNTVDFTEQRLNQLINDLDTNWVLFWKKWQKKLNVADEKELVVGTAKIKKGKKGLRHLIIKGERNNKEVLDLVVPDMDSEIKK